jgi:hypothetical protein
VHGFQMSGSYVDVARKGRKPCGDRPAGTLNSAPKRRSCRRRDLRKGVSFDQAPDKSDSRYEVRRLVRLWR